MATETSVLRALGALLLYPGPALRAALPEIAEAIEAAALLNGKARASLAALVEEIAAADPMDGEAAYVELFERRRSTSLYLFEHVHGEARDRGTAMIELKELYAAGGLDLARGELPDYLPVVLEYLSGRDRGEARAMLADCAHILRLVGETLMRRGSGYAAVLDALLAIAGESGIDPARARRRALDKEDLDRDWGEQPAFAPAAQTGKPSCG